MASRTIFIANGDREHLVREVHVDFAWSPGFAPVQKKKNITALHNAARNRGMTPLLEVSTKSDSEIGWRLSAFNLKLDTPIGAVSVEAAYQGSKIFTRGGPFT